MLPVWSNRDEDGMWEIEWRRVGDRNECIVIKLLLIYIIY